MSRYEKKSKSNFKVIILISLILILIMSTFVVVNATIGNEDNIFETLRTLINNNTNKIEKLENEINTLKEQITELQKPKEEEKTAENKNTSTSSNKSNKTSTNKTTVTSKDIKQIETIKNNVEELNKKDTQQTTNIEELKKEIEILKNNIAELEKKDNQQITDIEKLKSELDSKCEELKSLVEKNNNSKEIEELKNNIEELVKENDNNILDKKDLIGTWTVSDTTTITFNDNNTATEISYNTETSRIATNKRDGDYYFTITAKLNYKYIRSYTYKLEENHITLTLVDVTKQMIGGTKIISSYHYMNANDIKRETIEIEAEKEAQPVTDDDERLGMEEIYIDNIINNKLYINNNIEQWTKE